jgi:hypothetical protein
VTGLLVVGAVCFALGVGLTAMYQGINPPGWDAVMRWLDGEQP